MQLDAHLGRSGAQPSRAGHRVGPSDDRCLDVRSTPVVQRDGQALRLDAHAVRTLDSSEPGDVGHHLSPHARVRMAVGLAEPARLQSVQADEGQPGRFGEPTLEELERSARDDRDLTDACGEPFERRGDVDERRCGVGVIDDRGERPVEVERHECIRCVGVERFEGPGDVHDGTQLRPRSTWRS